MTMCLIMPNIVFFCIYLFCCLCLPDWQTDVFIKPTGQWYKKLCRQFVENQASLVNHTILVDD